jgi:hypothetical protein
VHRAFLWRHYYSGEPIEVIGKTSSHGLGPADRNKTERNSAAVQPAAQALRGAYIAKYQLYRRSFRGIARERRALCQRARAGIQISARLSSRVSDSLPNDQSIPVE